jgi:hypothetical protein
VPAVLRALLGGVSGFWFRNNYGPGTFSPFDVVGHLIHAERTNWVARLWVMREHGEALPLPAFGRYALYEAGKGKSMALRFIRHTLASGDKPSSDQGGVSWRNCRGAWHW